MVSCLRKCVSLYLHLTIPILLIHSILAYSKSQIFDYLFRIRKNSEKSWKILTFSIKKLIKAKKRYFWSLSICYSKLHFCHFWYTVLIKNKTSACIFYSTNRDVISIYFHDIINIITIITQRWATQFLNPPVCQQSVGWILSNYTLVGNPWSTCTRLIILEEKHTVPDKTLSTLAVFCWKWPTLIVCHSNSECHTKKTFNGSYRSKVELHFCSWQLFCTDTP